MENRSLLNMEELTFECHLQSVKGHRSCQESTSGNPQVKKTTTKEEDCFDEISNSVANGLLESVNDFDINTSSEVVLDDIPSDHAVNTNEIPAISHAQVETTHQSSIEQEVSNTPRNEQSLTVTLPKVRERVRFIDPDTNKLAEFMVVSRAGKVGKSGVGAYKNWLNVKDVKTKAMKSIDFENILDWEKVNTESVYNVETSCDVSEAQHKELTKWRDYNVYDEVEDKGQDITTTHWAISEKSHDGKTEIKARLVAQGFEEDTIGIRTDSPTVNKENFRLVCNIGATHGWKILQS